MKRNSKGFTLIELVTVIAILGVLAAMTVPKFFSLQTKAAIEVENQIIGTIKAGLETYGANQIVFAGTKVYPDTDAALLTAVLNPIPGNWSFATGAATGVIKDESRSDSTVTWDYKRPADATYTIDNRTATLIP